MKATVAPWRTRAALSSLRVVGETGKKALPVRYTLGTRPRGVRSYPFVRGEARTHFIITHPRRQQPIPLNSHVDRRSGHVNVC